MSKRTFVGVMVVALAVVVMAGGLLASNMGFKLNYTLTQLTAGVSKSGTNTLALPDNRQNALNTAKDLMNDIGFASTTSVAKFLKSSDTLYAYTGRIGSPAVFALTAGEGYFVKMKTTINYIVVGSDNPLLTTTLQQLTAGVSKTGTNFYAYNYHQTAATAKELMNDIGFASTTSVAKFLKSSDALYAYTGRLGSPADFALVPGEAYYIKMKTTVNYTPSHY